MKERERVIAVRDGIAESLGTAAIVTTRIKVLPRERVRVFPNQLIARFDGREYTITITENRKSRLK